MTAHAQSRNAALWYAPDGYDPAAKGINGRRVAGESFLRGFLSHVQAEEAVILARSEAEFAPVRDLAARLRPGLALRAVPMAQPQGIAPVQTVFHPGPNIGAEAWQRSVYGSAAWSLCGITHTISTAAVMQGWLDLRVAPTGDWDAVICTSHAVKAAVETQFDLIDDHLRRHLNASPGPRPQLPVLPLGIHCDDFLPDPAAGAALRARIGAGPGDCVFACIARLTPHEKFDPLPVYLALAAAQARLAGIRLHLILCGQFRDDHSRQVFAQGAARLMPEVPLTLLDGASADDRKATLSAADVFLFPIDNIQETFGLAPVEGMAAGLPVLCTDWDGLRDTVAPGTGFRITTRGLPPAHLAADALRHHARLDSYGAYCATASALTEVDMAELTARIVDLAQNSDLRRRMGQAARAHARATFDWCHIIPRMQDLWAELAARRAAATGLRHPSDALPVAPSPTRLFAAWPTEQADLATPRFAACEGAAPLETLLDLRNYPALKRIFAPADRLAAALAAVQAAGPGGITRDQIATSLRLTPAGADRVLIWLLKYALVRRLP